MDTNEIKDIIAEYNPEALLADGFDDAILGVGNQHGSPEVVIYDSDKCIEILADQFKEDSEDPHTDAVEYFEYNTKGAYVGPGTPIFVTKIGE